MIAALRLAAGGLLSRGFTSTLSILIFAILIALAALSDAVALDRTDKRLEELVDRGATVWVLEAEEPILDVGRCESASRLSAITSSGGALIEPSVQIGPAESVPHIRLSSGAKHAAGLTFDISAISTNTFKQPTRIFDPYQPYSSVAHANSTSTRFPQWDGSLLSTLGLTEEANMCIFEFRVSQTDDPSRVLSGHLPFRDRGARIDLRRLNTLNDEFLETLESRNDRVTRYAPISTAMLALFVSIYLLRSRSTEQGVLILSGVSRFQAALMVGGEIALCWLLAGLLVASLSFGANLVGAELSPAAARITPLHALAGTVPAFLVPLLARISTRLTSLDLLLRDLD